MNDGFGTQSRRRFAYWNHDESCLKMFLDCLPLTEGTLFATSCTTFPAWASMQNMALFERPTPPSLPRTGAPGGFASLPTPRAQNAETRNSKPWIRPLDEPQNLENAIARLLPTPTARDWKDTGDLKKSVPDDDSLLPRAIAHHVISDPTQEQSDDGNGSSDDQPPPQAMIEDSDPSLSSG